MAQKARKPKGLSPSSSQLWASIVAEYEFSACELAILEAGLQSRDRYITAKEEIDRDGLILEDRFGRPIKHPAISIECRQRDAFLSAMKMLKLNTSGLQ